MADAMAARHRLLVIDDEALINILVRSVAKREEAPIEVHAVLNGEEAPGVALEFQPGLILLDVRLPGIDGFEIHNRLKANPGTREIPVVFMTALDTRRVQERITASGARDFIWKPPDIKEIRRVIRSYLLPPISP